MKNSNRDEKQIEVFSQLLDIVRKSGLKHGEIISMLEFLKFRILLKNDELGKEDIPDYVG